MESITLTKSELGTYFDEENYLCHLVPTGVQNGVISFMVSFRYSTVAGSTAPNQRVGSCSNGSTVFTVEFSEDAETVTLSW